MDKPLRICYREEKVVFCEIHFTGCFRVLSMLPSQAAGEISGVGERDNPKVLVLGKWIDCGDMRKGTGL